MNTGSSRRTLRPSAMGLAVLAILTLVASCTRSSTPTSPTAATSLTVTLVSTGADYQATAVAAFSDGSSREVSSSAQWMSTNTAVATVSSTGRVTPVSAGSTEIRASFDSVSGSAALTVLSAPISPAPVPSPSPPPPPPPYELTGLVRDGLDAEPVGGVTVTLASSQGSASAVTRGDGTYAIQIANAGGSVDVTVTAALNGYATQTVHRTLASSSTLDLTLAPLPFTLTGTVADGKDGESPWCEPIRVEFLDGPNAGRYVEFGLPAETTQPAPYEIANIQPGTSSVRASAPEYQDTTVTARLRGATPFNRLDIRLCRAPSCTLSRPSCPT